MPDSSVLDLIRCVRTVAQDEWRASIELRGEIDLACAPELEEHLAAHLAAGRRVLRIDTERLDFIDCTALHVLMRADAQCRERRGSLILSGVPGRLSRLLRVLGLDGVLLVDCADRAEVSPVVSAVG